MDFEQFEVEYNDSCAAASSAPGEWGSCIPMSDQTFGSQEGSMSTSSMFTSRGSEYSGSPQEGSSFLNNSIMDNSSSVMGTPMMAMTPMSYGGTSFSTQPMMTFGQALDMGEAGGSGGGGGIYRSQPQASAFGGWGQASAMMMPSGAEQQQGGCSGRWKRNADEAELGEFKEIGTNLDDLDIGHNAPKIRTMDFDEAATMTKAGYVVDDAFLAFEELKKQKDEEWDWERPTRTNFSSEPLKTTLKDVDLGDKPIKIAKRRKALFTNDDDWEEEIKLKNFIRFGNTDGLKTKQDY